MLTAPWSREVMAMYRGEDIGISLVLTSNHDIFRMAPLTQSPTLIDGTGELPRSLGEFWEHADTGEVRRECRAQIERAIFYGFDPSHLSSDSQALMLKPEFFDVLVEVALEFGLPLRVITQGDPNHRVFPAFELAAEEGIVTPTQQVSILDHLSTDTDLEAALESALVGLEVGISEISFKPALASTELKALMPNDWQQYTRAHAVLTSSRGAKIMNDLGIGLIGYRDLKRVQSEIRTGAE